jgi:cell division protein FtsI (penicillin-binding protein 3)
MTSKKKNNKTNILMRYTMISIVLLLISFGVIYKLFEATIIDAGAWNARAERELSRVATIAPERGNILADNGNILACNLKVYDIMLDLRHNKIRKLRQIPWQSIDSLADSLDTYFPRRAGLNAHPDTFAKYTWHKRLREEFEKNPEKRRTNLRIAAKRTLDDFEKVRRFPFLKDFKGSGYRIPVYKNARDIRIYPYGKMAYRSIGRVNEDFRTGEFHGYSGLEKDLDSLLYGKPGRTKKVALTSGIANWTDVPAIRGYDIVTTIDIDLQDMLEHELLKVCTDAKAEWGTAILMEVATGEIKAVSNIELLADGSYGEALNRAVIGYEPGSVMKPISLMIAFEDGLVRSVNDVVSCAPFQRTSDPHGSGMKSMKQVIEQSSNPGIARVIFRGYEKDPSKFHDRLASIGFFEPMRSGIADEERPRVRKLLPKDSRGNNITMTARHLDLARQAYGYNTTIPPLYTLAYYNAIANGGVMVRPHLVRSLRGEDGRDSVVDAGCIRKHVCSPETAEKVKQCIREVVWGKHASCRTTAWR